MVKDHFYYCLRDRLGFAQEHAHECVTRLRHIELNKKADYEFFRNNKFLFIFEEILNLPSNICKLYKVSKMKINLKKCLSDIQVMQQELNNYESNNQEDNRC